ncbi:MAG: trehalase family glycosidase, partial [Bacteroidales bacterium]
FVTPNTKTFVGQWYWDTMGTNIGLLRSDNDNLRAVALSMVKNLFLLYDKNKLIPNAADSVQNTRSQPPFLTSMCLDIAEHLFKNDTEEKLKWYQSAYEYCKKEALSPWESHATDHGFRWFDNIKEMYTGYSPEEILHYFRPESRSDYRVLRSLVFKALDVDIENEKPFTYEKIKAVILKALARLSNDQRKELAEWLFSRRLLVASGMDFTASYGLKTMPLSLEEILEPEMLLNSDKVYSRINDISPLDLNCLLYKYYGDLSFMAEKLIKADFNKSQDYYKAEIQIWNLKRSKLKNLIMETHFSETHGCFYNYDVQNLKPITGLPHLTHYAYPLFAGLVDENHALELTKQIGSLTTEFGVKLTSERTGYQWDFNMWPLQVWIAVQGLRKYGFENEAKNISDGYIRCVEKVFRSEGSFYEKYNAENGTIETDGRYPSEAGFSWGAAVYLGLCMEK